MNDNKITAADALQRAHDEIVRLHKSVMKFNGIEHDGADNSVAEEIRTAIAASAQDTSATPGMHARVVSITPGVGHITLDLGRAIPEWADLSCTVTIVEHPSACIATLAEPAQAPPVVGHGKKSMLYETAKMLLGRYDEMRTAKGAPAAVEFELLRTAISAHDDDSDDIPATSAADRGAAAVHPPVESMQAQQEKCRLRLCCRDDSHVEGCNTYDPARYPDKYADNPVPVPPVAWMDPNESCAMDAFLWSYDPLTPRYNVPVYLAAPNSATPPEKQPDLAAIVAGAPIDQQVAGAPDNGGLIDLIEQAQKIAPSLTTRVYELTPVQVAWIVGKSKPLAVGSDTTGTKLNDLISYERNARGSDGEPPYSVEDFYFAGDVQRLVETILAPSGDGDRHGARQLAIGRAVERACNELPPGFEVEVMLERDAGTVTLYCPEGYGTDECPDADTFDERINHAIDAAIKRTSTC